MDTKIYRPIIFLLGIIFFGISSSANSVPLTVRSLTWSGDPSDPIIRDSLNNREWLRWDRLAPLNYAETLAAISPGGAYQGWTIATEEDAFLFVDAATNIARPALGNKCSRQPNMSWARQVCRQFGGGSRGFPNELAELVGNARHDGLFNITSVFFLSDPLAPGANTYGGYLKDEEVGILSIFDYNHPTFSLLDYTKIEMIREWNSIARSDVYSETGWHYSSRDVLATSWLLYRNSPIPEPAMLPLLLGMFSLMLLGTANTKKENVLNDS